MRAEQPARWPAPFPRLDALRPCLPSTHRHHHRVHPICCAPPLVVPLCVFSVRCPWRGLRLLAFVGPSVCARAVVTVGPSSRPIGPAAAVQCSHRDQQPATRGSATQCSTASSADQQTWQTMGRYEWPCESVTHRQRAQWDSGAAAISRRSLLRGVTVAASPAD